MRLTSTAVHRLDQRGVAPAQRAARIDPVLPLRSTRFLIADNIERGHGRIERVELSRQYLHLSPLVDVA
jgi:hypothetical protein